MKKYRSKIGLELIGFFVLLTVLFVVVEEDPWFPLFWVPFLLFICAIIFSIRYTVGNGLIVVHHSLFIKKEIQIKSIRKIRESNNPLSSPAASMDRLEVFYNGADQILISPVRTEEFLQDLLKVNPEIEIIRMDKPNIFSKLAV